jgi:hypothetical protein
MRKRLLNSMFNTWKLWLSSAVFFAGVLTAGLIPGCAHGRVPTPTSECRGGADTIQVHDRHIQQNCGWRFEVIDVDDTVDGAAGMLAMARAPYQCAPSFQNRIWPSFWTCHHTRLGAFAVLRAGISPADECSLSTGSHGPSIRSSSTTGGERRIFLKAFIHL